LTGTTKLAAKNANPQGTNATCGTVAPNVANAKATTATIMNIVFNILLITPFK
jgi:hypothetical protein